MDLLGNYGSDADSDDEQQPQNAGRAVAVERTTDATASAGIKRAGLFAALPPPRAKDDVLGGLGGNERSGSLFAALPPPKAPAGLQHITDLQSDLGLPVKSAILPPPKRGVVQFRPPIDPSFLSRNDSDDDDAWVPPKKKERKVDAAVENKPGKPSFASFLPPPKNSLGAGNILGGGAAGGRKMVMEAAAGLDASEERPRIASETSVEGATPSTTAGGTSGASSFVNGGSAHAGSAGYHYPPETTNGVANQTGYTGTAALPGTADRGLGPGLPQGQSEAAPHSQPAFQNEPPSTSAYAAAQNSAAAGATWQAPVGATWQSDASATWRAAVAPPVDLLTAKLMEEEARKRKRGGGKGGVNGPQIVEVKQADIAGGGYRREDMLKNNAATFGPQMQPMSSAKEAGPGKMERRKHQISSLYADMKKKEMEMMDSRASGLQNKTQTKGKYGW